MTEPPLPTASPFLPYTQSELQKQNPLCEAGVETWALSASPFSLSGLWEASKDP